MPTPLDELSERQREVLELHNAGKNPTQIGRELNIKSQAVHGHFRRLRDHGYDIEGPQPRAARERKSGRSGPFDATDALAVVHRAATEGIASAENRQAEIDKEIAALKAERKKLDGTIAELRTHLPAEPSA